EAPRLSDGIVEKLRFPSHSCGREKVRGHMNELRNDGDKLSLAYQTLYMINEKTLLKLSLTCTNDFYCRILNQPFQAADNVAVQLGFVLLGKDGRSMSVREGVTNTSGVVW
ncbi:hypothetical protein HAX54_000271, partial [Datura stramonium]|nr:hypothetical protein [Datura stramonium]